MADINARLKRALDGPAPQHKVAGRSEFEVTEGTNGALHVNVVNQPEQGDVTVGNFPEVQNVKDVGVSAELAEIKRTQADILERLDRPIDTQVTGSNVEDGILVKPNKNFIEVEVAGNDVEPGKDQVFDVYSKPGEIWTLKRFGYFAYRNTDSTGKHLIWIYHGESQSDSNFIMSIEGESKQFMRGTIPGRRQQAYTGDVTPSDIYEMVETIRDTSVLSNSLPIKIRYRNQGDQTVRTPIFKLFFMVEKVGNNVG